jgi:hypothetical protein
MDSVGKSVSADFSCLSICPRCSSCSAGGFDERAWFSVFSYLCCSPSVQDCCLCCVLFVVNLAVQAIGTAYIALLVKALFMMPFYTFRTCCTMHQASKLAKGPEWIKLELWCSLLFEFTISFMTDIPERLLLVLCSSVASMNWIQVHKRAGRLYLHAQEPKLWIHGTLSVTRVLKNLNSESMEH